LSCTLESDQLVYKANPVDDVERSSSQPSKRADETHVRARSIVLESTPIAVVQEDRRWCGNGRAALIRILDSASTMTFTPAGTASNPSNW
jgi:hypothetical protein